MDTKWRVSTANGVLVAAYFLSTWLIAAWRIGMSPIHGLYERPQIAVAIFVSDQFHPTAAAAIRIAWLLALAKVTVVAFFVLFVVLAFRRSVRQTGGCDEAFGIAVTLGIVISFASMAMASHVGEHEALRLHATELLMLLGAAVLTLIERPLQPLPASASPPIGLNLTSPSPT